MLGDPADADGLAHLRDGAQNAAALREVPDAGDGRRVHSHMDEIDERPVPPQDPESGVPGAGQIPGR